MLSISNNGGINIGVPQTTLGYINFGLPDLFNDSTSVMLPLWDDFGSSSGDVYYQTNGSAPNRSSSSSGPIACTTRPARTATVPPSK